MPCFQGVLSLSMEEFDGWQEPGKKNKNVIRYRRSDRNIAVIFFGFILVYLIVCIYMYLTSAHISGYEVIEGNLATDYRYMGIALRTEQVYTAEKAGYVNYYASENEKVSVLLHSLYSG